MAATKVSVAEARQDFAGLIKRAQQGNAIEITRRGEPVAVLLSTAEYSALKGERSSFIDTDGLVAGPWIPNPTTGVRFLLSVPFPCVVQRQDCTPPACPAASI